MGRDLLSSTREHWWTWRPELGFLKSSMEESSYVSQCCPPTEWNCRVLDRNWKKKNHLIHPRQPPSSSHSPPSPLFLPLLDTVPVTAEIREVKLDLPQRDALELYRKQSFRNMGEGNFLLTVLLQSRGVNCWSLHNPLQSLLLAYKRCLALLPPQWESSKHSPGDQNHFLFGLT